jgi:hypothetical protein
MVSLDADLARMSLDTGEMEPIEHTLTDRWADPAKACALTVTTEDEVVLATLDTVYRARLDSGAVHPVTRAPLRSEMCVAAFIQVAAGAGGSVFAAVAADYLVAVTGTNENHVHDAENRFWGVAMTADGSLLANGREDGTVELRDPATLEVRRALTGLSTCVLSMSFSPSDRILVAGDDLHGLCSWDLATGEMRRHDMPAKVVNIAWLPDESGFLATGLTRMLKSFAPDDADGELLIVDGLGTRYFQDAALVDERTLAISLEQSRAPERETAGAPESECVMVVDFG